MNCLVIVAHPLKASFVATLAEAAIAEARARGHEVRVEDLYAQHFSPAMTAEERAGLHSGYDSSAVSQHAENLLWAEVLILAFPTWWFSFPAILKGWFDRVWVPGIAYDQAPDGGPLMPRLGQLKVALAITTLGSPWWVDWLVMRRPVRRVLKLALLHSCAPGCALTFKSFYAADKLDADAVAAATICVRQAVSRL